MNNDMKTNIPAKYQAIWEAALPLLKQGRPGDDEHALTVVETLMNYNGDLKFDLDVLVPVAIMHDIGHSAILPEHFKYITGFEKVENGKLVHMLVGAKIAKDILESVGYDANKIEEIVEIVSMHDADQLKNVDITKVYDSVNKKIFHDIDSLDRFNDKRLATFGALSKDQDKVKLLLEKSLGSFFYDDFRGIAEKYMNQ